MGDDMPALLLILTILAMLLPALGAR